MTVVPALERWMSTRSLRSVWVIWVGELLIGIPEHRQRVFLGTDERARDPVVKSASLGDRRHEQALTRSTGKRICADGE